MTTLLRTSETVLLAVLFVLVVVLVVLIVLPGLPYWAVLKGLIGWGNRIKARLDRNARPQA